MPAARAAVAASARPQLGIQRVAHGIAEHVEAEYGERDREAWEYRDPWRALGILLGAAAQHQSPSRRRFLHAHHVNGLKWDNSVENLRALCIRCHSDQPMHSHIKAMPAFSEYLTLPGIRMA